MAPILADPTPAMDCKAGTKQQGLIENPPTPLTSVLWTVDRRLTACLADGSVLAGVHGDLTARQPRDRPRSR